MGIVIAVASGKGGTGKTSFCAGVSAVLCAMGEKVLLIDADAGLRNLDLVLGMTDSLLFSYADVMMGRATLKEAAVAHPLVKNLRVLTAPAEPCEISPPYIAALLQSAREHFSFTLIDCPSGLSGDLVSFAAYADRAVIVSTADHTSLRGAQRMADVFSQAGMKNSKIVVNRVRRKMMNTGASVNIDRAMDASGLSLLGVVPEDRDIITCANKGLVLVLHSSGCGQAAYTNIARRLRGERVPLLEYVKGHF